MKLIRDIQNERVRTLYQHLIRLRNAVPDIHEIETLTREILNNKTRLPLSGNYRPEGHIKLERNKLNTEIGLIYADIGTIFEYIRNYYDRVAELSFVFRTWKDFSNTRLNRINREATQFAIGDSFGFRTKEIDIIENMNTSISTADVSEDDKIELQKNTLSTSEIPAEKDISIDKIGDAGKATIIGIPQKIFKPNLNNQLLLSIDGYNSEDAGFRIIAKYKDTRANTIKIALGSDYRGLKVKIQVSEDRQKYKTVHDGIANRPDIEAYFDRGPIQEVRIELTRSYPNIETNTNELYEFIIDRIIIGNTNISDEVIYRTNRIELGNNLTAIQLLFDYDLQTGSRIDFSVSTTEDEDGNPVSFYPITPGDTSSFIHFTNVSHYLTLSPNNPLWNIEPEIKYGSRLYNILTNVDDITTEEYKIEDSKLHSGDNFEIILETIKLYRGHNDFILKTERLSIERYSDPIVISPIYDPATKWMKPIPILVKYRHILEERDISGIDTGETTISVSGKLYKTDDIIIEREDGVKMDTPILSTTFDGTHTYIVVNTTEVQFSRSYYYFITTTITMLDYVRKTENHITIDTTRMEVLINDEFLTYGKDYVIDQNMFQLTVARTTLTSEFTPESSFKYDTNDSDADKDIAIDISYHFTETRRDKSPFYETWIYVDSPRSIMISPFTGYELSQGNFHRINGENVSSRNQYQLSTGWNLVQTTHPHRSANEYDINAYTKQPSNAGIIIGENLLKRAFRDSMRQVSPFSLMSMSYEESLKCFAIDNGKILVAFRPDYTKQSVLNMEDMSYQKGRYVLAKIPNYDGSFNNTVYTSQAEEFAIEFNAASISPEHERFIYLHIEMQGDKKGATSTINKIGYNEYTEDIDE